jgi:hypothetical protein
MFKPKGQPCGHKPHSQFVDRSCPFGITTLLSCNKNCEYLVCVHFYYNIFLKIRVKFSAINSRKFWGNLAAENSPACPKAGGASARSADWENLISSKNSQFVSYSMAPESKLNQTFDIILPNLIHKSKKRNLT